MKITLIAEGSTRWQRLLRRWGLSILVNEDTLFDAFGHVGVFSGKLKKFKIDIAKIRHIVISHDDWDHVAGLWYLLQRNKEAKVYVCPGFDPKIKEKIASFGHEVKEVRGVTAITDSVYSTGELTLTSSGEAIYEQALVIKTENGLAVICGCAHPGIINIVEYIRNQLRQDVHCVVGGLHLKDVSRENAEAVIMKLKALGVRTIVPLHCTGRKAVRLINALFGERCVSMGSGQSVEM